MNSNDVEAQFTCAICKIPSWMLPRCAAGGNWKNFKLGIDFLTVVRYSIENKEKPMRKRSTQSREHYRELQAVGLQYGNI